MPGDHDVEYRLINGRSHASPVTYDRFDWIESQPWMKQAACRGNWTVFFPPRTQGGGIRVAKRICAECTVRDQCLEYALEIDEREGVWGGLSSNERKQIRQRRNRARRDQTLSSVG